MDVTGAGVVEMFTIVRRASSAAFVPPHTVAVAPDEGPRLLSNIEPWQDAAIGARVRVHWRPLDDGRNLPVFSLG